MIKGGRVIAPIREPGSFEVTNPGSSGRIYLNADSEVRPIGMPAGGALGPAVGLGPMYVTAGGTPAKPATPGRIGPAIRRLGDLPAGPIFSSPHVGDCPRVADIGGNSLEALLPLPSAVCGGGTLGQALA